MKLNFHDMKSQDIQNIQVHDSGSYTRMQFLRAVSHSVDEHADAPQTRHDASIGDEDVAATCHDSTCCSDWDDCHITSSATAATPSDVDNYCTICEVCLIGQRDGVALVPCGHARFCATCVDWVVSIYLFIYLLHRLSTTSCKVTYAQRLLCV